MTKDDLVTVPVGTTLEQAKEILHKNRIEKLLVVDGKNNLRGLITIKDILKIKKYPFACKDGKGRLRVGAALGVGPGWEERVDKLLKAGADLLCVDTAHGHAKDVVDAVRSLRKNFPRVQLIAGNVATGEGADALIKAGVDCVKVGVGPGSICTTRVIAGVGVPQVTAIMKCAPVAQKKGIPLIADGGIKYSGDITKAMAAGASAVMIGGLFAGTDESPGELVLYQGRSYKVYRGMGSLEAMKRGSKDRYFQSHVDAESKLVPEGIEGRVPYRGPLAGMAFQLVGGLKSGMGYVGARNIAELQKRAVFMKITPAGLRESHVHDVIITKEAPNYRVE
jgi:IMP dehydrogenase